MHHVNVVAAAPGSPLATVVIPVLNEERGIADCLASVLANTLPDGEIEFLVIDGGSTDRSRAIIADHARRDPRLRLLDNPARLQAAAFNIGIAEARGPYLVRMDAHSLYAADYVAESIRLLEATGAVNVGGVQRAAGHTPLGRAIAAAVSSPFAAGDAKYRNATAPSWVDTVYLGAWRTADLRAIGGMRTDLAVNEDYEMNVRLRSRGGRIHLSPSIRSTYFVRGSLPKLARQYARYGFWKVRTLMDHPQSLRWRQLVAPVFVLGVAVTPLVVFAVGWLGAAHLVLYGIVNVASSIVVASRTSWRNLPVLPLIFLTIHVAWGGGFWAGLITWPVRQVVGSRARA
jgi:succinoglycan biosynthesis protein ExoA